MQFRYADTYAKLFATIVTLEKERLPFLISCFIESDIVVAFWTSYSLHALLVCLVLKCVAQRVLTCLVAHYPTILEVGFLMQLVES